MQIATSGRECHSFLFSTNPVWLLPDASLFFLWLPAQGWLASTRASAPRAAEIVLLRKSKSDHHLSLFAMDLVCDVGTSPVVVSNGVLVTCNGSRYGSLRTTGVVSISNSTINAEIAWLGSAMEMRFTAHDGCSIIGNLTLADVNGTANAVCVASAQMEMTAKFSRCNSLGSAFWTAIRL
jgi:hypothetical protein